MKRMKEKDVRALTARRCEELRVTGPIEDPAENARTCQCLGWDDLAGMWRSLI